MKSKFEYFLEKLDLEYNLKCSINNGYNLLFEMTGTSSASGSFVSQIGSDGMEHIVNLNPSGYNGGHATVFNDDNEFDGNEGEDTPFKFKLPSLVNQSENDVQNIKDKFKSFLIKLHSMGDQGDKKNLIEAIMKSINILI